MYRIFSMNVAHPQTQCGEKINFLNFQQYLQFIFCIIPMRININYANFHCVSESSWQILFLNKSCFSSCLSKQVFIIFQFLVVSSILIIVGGVKGPSATLFPKELSRCILQIVNVFLSHSFHHFVYLYIYLRMYLFIYLLYLGKVSILDFLWRTIHHSLKILCSNQDDKQELCKSSEA